MPLDPINPIGPRPAARPGEIPGVRRVDSTTDKRERENGQNGPRKRRQAQVPDLPPPPDDGRPHVDIRV